MMKMQQPKIITLDAEKLFTYYAKKLGQENEPYCFDTKNRYYYSKVVKQISDFDECPLLHQIIQSKVFKNKNIDTEASDDWLLDKLIIIDLSSIFYGSKQADNGDDKRQEWLKGEVRDLMEKGLDISYQDHNVHMLPFDKSGNMSRKSRISFINKEYFDELNESLNLGIDFSEIEVALSKYYAYRGLYLTSSKRVEGIDITPETLVILKDKKMYETQKSIKTGDPEDKREVLGPANERNIPIITAKKSGKVNPFTGKDIWEFTEEDNNDREYVETVFDGVGMVSPEYAVKINKALGLDGATSFQVRLPFAKGMMHQVNFKEFLKEFDKEYANKKEYYYEDAFGIKRDLKKAEILLTESMFKAKEWITKDFNGDPMKRYCKALNAYGHSLYISGTDLPYGKSEYTHLNYQVLNTLDITDDEFKMLLENHTKFIKKPMVFINGWDSSEAIDYEEPEIKKDEETWKKALKKYPDFEDDAYIKSQLDNTKKGLITKIANGKLAVEGQVRYLCRDLMPMLATLLQDEREAGNFYNRILNMRFFMPGVDNLKYSRFYAFFRNPHLSRNEQSMLRPFVIPDEGENYKEIRPAGTGFFELRIDKYKKYIGFYNKYFGHLTGVVMVPRGSTLPLSLGGADFDGDLVRVVFDENVVNAVIRGCYIDKNTGTFPSRKLPVIKIPQTDPVFEKVPKSVPYKHIEDTFSNSIGYLSNTAIKIGQAEYAGDGSGKCELTCWMITILTGLDIDAAKNGSHPDLSIITDNAANIPKATYLKFLRKYTKLRKNPDFSIDKIKIKNKDDDKDSFEISVSGVKTKVSYSYKMASYGTKINKLPVAFKDACLSYKQENSGGTKKIAPFIDNTKNGSKELKEYKKDCEQVIKLYKWYIDFVKILKKEKNKNSDAIDKLIYKEYDEDSAVKIYSEVLPDLIAKLDRAIPYDVAISEVQKRMNTERWQYMPFEKRGETLERIIGGGFKAQDLNEDESKLLFHFGQYGFKMLWHILSRIDATRIRPYEDMKDEYSKEKARPDISEDELDEVARMFYEENLSNVESRIYGICLDKIKRIKEKTKLSDSDKISAFYDMVGKDEIKGRFFWDTFSWKELEWYIAREDAQDAK